MYSCPNTHGTVMKRLLVGSVEALEDDVELGVELRVLHAVRHRLQLFRIQLVEAYNAMKGYRNSLRGFSGSKRDIRTAHGGCSKHTTRVPAVVVLLIAGGVLGRQFVQCLSSPPSSAG